MSKQSRRPNRENRPKKKRARQRANVKADVSVSETIYLDNPELALCQDCWHQLLQRSHPA